MHVYLDLFVLLFAYFYVQFASKMLYKSLQFIALSAVHAYSSFMFIFDLIYIMQGISNNAFQPIDLITCITSFMHISRFISHC